MEKLESRLSEINIENQNVTADNKWGMPLKDLYRLGLSFYKDKSTKAVQISYEDNLKLVAFTQQAAHGPLSPNAPPIGAFDVIGRDRRLAWQNLGNINRSQAMEGFVELLDRLCPPFRPYVEAIKKDQEDKQRVAHEEDRRRKEQLEQEKQRKSEEMKQEEQRSREELQKRKLQDALNQQTYQQFREYAEKQYPGNPEQQGILIRQLQNEHYHQYMQQLHAQLANDSNDGLNGTAEHDLASLETGVNASSNTNGHQLVINKESQAEDKETCDSDNESTDYHAVSPANMWTKADIQQFKTEVSSGKGEGVIKVGYGDVVTVRVPTREGGNCLYWEFATDSYDIGFGVYFEWGKSTTNEVSVQVCDSEDEDELEGADEEDDEIQSSNDVESGVKTSAVPTEPSTPPTRWRPPVSSVVPVYRRECQNEVYVGSHTYPGEGTYLLKFDNSYSLWRSKTLYYRVFYTR